MKKWMILMFALLLSGCSQIDIDEPDDDAIFEPVDAYDEVAPHFEEIETLLAEIELEVGLGNLKEASSFFNDLMEIVNEHEVTHHQQSRINTMAELLRDTLAGDDERIFSGSDAAAKVMNLIGEVPIGYTFVYHEIPSQVGLDGFGYYVFLVPIEHTGTSEMEIRKAFFVTESGEISTFE